MSQSIPEVLDYRDLLGKLARIDSEWESLKGLLTFKSPYKDGKPAKNSAVNDESQMDMGNKVVGFPQPSCHVKTRTKREGGRSTMAVTPMEMEVLSQKIRENSHDEMSMERLIKVEKQIHKLTLLVITFMTLTIALFAVLTFLKFKDNLLYRSAFHQPKEMTAPADLAGLEPKVLAKTHQTSSAVPVASGSQLADAAALPAGKVGKSLETESSPAAAEPAPKFVGSITSNKIHSPDCKWAAKIKPERLITFSSMAEAREQGYIPCPVCQPHESHETH
jgi:hypothetical protein